MEKNLSNTDPKGTPFLDAVDKTQRLYRVPASYFEELAAEVITRIRLDNLSVSMDYEVPKGYFSQLPAQIMDRIHSERQGLTKLYQTYSFKDPAVVEELKAVAPFLLQIGNHNVYQVPADFFEQFEAQRQSAPETQKAAAKVIPLTRRKRIWRAAVAVAAVLVVLFSGERYFMEHQEESTIAESSNQFASKISTDNDSFRAGLSELTDQEILSYLSTPTMTLVDSVNEQLEEETQKAISTMTNEELESYLERTPAIY